MLQLPANQITRRSIFVVILSLLVLITIGLLTYFKTDLISRDKPSQYTYQRLKNYTMVGQQSGMGMGFKAPTELTELTALAGQAELTHGSNPDSKNPSSYIAAASVEHRNYTESDFQAIATALSSPSRQYYSSVTDPVEKYIEDRVSAEIKVELEPARPFTNPNIKKNAWQFDFNVTNPKGRLTGKVIYAFTDDTTFYFMVIAPDYNWQQNQKIWAQVLDSLQIDQ